MATLVKNRMTEQTNTTTPMSLVAHLTELRDRLLRAVLAVLIGFIILFPFANEIYGFVSAPLRELMPEGSTMIATGVASPFLTPSNSAWCSRSLWRYL